MSGTVDVDPVHAALQATGSFVWTHLPRVVIVSVAWFLCVLPVVTAGPATIGAYRAITSIRETGRIELDAVAGTVRSQFVHATLLGLLPVVLVAMTATYAVTFLSTGRVLPGVLALGGLYATAYLCLILVPTFVGLAHGSDVSAAVTNGVLWTARNAVEAAVLGILTVAFFALSTIMTVALVLVFAGATFAFHVEYLTTDQIDPLPEPHP